MSERQRANHEISTVRERRLRAESEEATLNEHQRANHETSCVAGPTGGWRRWLPGSPADWTMAVFGGLALLLGLLGLVWPEGLLAALGFQAVESADRAPGDYTRVFVAASSMASFNMGVYYLVAVATRWRPFYRFTVAFRLLTWAVFTTLVVADVAPIRFLAVGLWEGAGAVATGLCLVYEARSGPRSRAGQ